MACAYKSGASTSTRESFFFLSTEFTAYLEESPHYPPTKDYQPRGQSRCCPKPRPGSGLKGIQMICPLLDGLKTCGHQPPLPQNPRMECWLPGSRCLSDLGPRMSSSRGVSQWLLPKQLQPHPCMERHFLLPGPTQPTQPALILSALKDKAGGALMW